MQYANVMNERPWVAVHVRSNQEKVVNDILAEKGCEPFLPLYRCRRRWCDRTKVLDLPLFTGYVFCRFEAHRWMPIHSTPGVLRILGFGGRLATVDDAEISSLKAIMRARADCCPWPLVRVGQRVRITHGCLAGVEGELIASRRQYRLVVNVDILGRSCAVNVDSAEVAPVSRA